MKLIKLIHRLASHSAFWNAPVPFCTHFRMTDPFCSFFLPLFHRKNQVSRDPQHSPLALGELCRMGERKNRCLGTVLEKPFIKETYGTITKKFWTWHLWCSDACLHSLSLGGVTINGSHEPILTAHGFVYDVRPFASWLPPYSYRSPSVFHEAPQPSKNNHAQPSLCMIKHNFIEF